MSIQAKLIVDDIEMTVLAFKYTFDKGHDTTGRPASKARLVGLQAMVEARSSNNLLDWSVHPNQMKQVEIHYTPRILGAKTRIIQFIDSHCVHYETGFSANGITPLTETIFITSAGLKDSLSAEEYSAYWRVTFPDTTEATDITEETPEILSCGYEDSHGNPIPENKVMVNDNIFFVLNTANATGKEVSIDLSSNTKDFEYNGSILEDDILKVVVTGDTMKLALKVINQQ